MRFANPRGFGRGRDGGHVHGRGQGRDVVRGRGRGEIHGGARRREYREREFPMGFRELENLIKNQDDGEVLLTMGNPNSGFIKLLQTRDHIRDNIIEMMLGVLSRVCNYTASPQTLSTLLNEVRNSSLLKEHLLTYFVKIRSSGRPEDYVEPIKQTVILCKTLLEKFPVGSIQTIDVLVTILQKAMKHNDYFSTHQHKLIEYVADLIDLCDDTMESQKPEKENKFENKQYFEEKLPPNDFRDLPIIPTTEDIKGDVEPFLRRNRIQGSYYDLENYLDVHFRLLREDFVRPLRTGISEFLRALQGGATAKRLTDVRIYDQVQILYPVCNQNGLSYRVKFDLRPFKKVRWQNSKRLIYGSLVCLSCDNFETLLFGTVANRDIKLLEHGEIEIQFEQTLGNVSPNDIYVMGETTAYFESYRPVLTGLKTVTDDFPFQDYLVLGKHDVQPPRYVQKKKHLSFDMSCLCKDLHEFSEDIQEERLSQRRQNRHVKKVFLLDRQSWPTQERLGLDQSQLEALYVALTRELAIIQGPPGTGKTYIGLKIVNCLINNVEYWQDNNKGPILVVCYTNHALDQFLEGIKPLCPDEIVRVGGRSRSEALKSVNLRDLRRKCRTERVIPSGIAQARFSARKQMEILDQKMHSIGTKIEATERGVIHELTLEPYMSNEHFNSLLGIRAFVGDLTNDLQNKRRSVLFEWLGLGDFLPKQQPPQQQVHEHLLHQQQLIAEDFEENEDNQLDDELDVDEEGEIEERMRVLEIGDIDHEEERQRRHERNERQARQDMVINIDEMQAIAENPDRNAMDGEWKVNTKGRKQRRRQLQRGLKSTDVMSEEEANQVNDLWAINFKQRWRLYRYWISTYKEELRREIRTDEDLFHEHAVRMKEVLNEEDAYIMKKAKIIGMTTTGAARYRDILQEIKPKVIIVEEAAEVLEAHIITTISSACEHLILIGDHQQLRPNPTVYDLAENYNLKVSLFERLINNGIPHVTLRKQHRMRPEISQFMGHIYPNLVDDDSVQNYDTIKGVSKNVFFLNHSFEEDHDEELISKGNFHEARFLAAFSQYLLNQGYPTTDITIITPYTGQLLKLKKYMPKTIFDGLRITAVDNFQGEENEIILISLVRSQKTKNLEPDAAKKLVGFVKEANRICVTLSRAKKGMYVMGNFDLLCKSNELWDKIITTARKNNMYGESIGLYCQNHPKDKGLFVKHSNDFKNVPEGGCLKPCEHRLECGHVCARVCHPYDKEHKDYKCMKVCNKKLCRNGHRCQKPCHMKCGPCMTRIPKLIIKCGHMQEVPCSITEDRFECKAECTKLLECGHNCKNHCGESHTDQCREEVEKELLCAHRVKIKCFENPLKVECPVPCKNFLLCEHECKGNCGKCHQGRLHIECTNRCGRILVCGHVCKVNCTKECPPCREPCRNRCVHSRCNERCGQKCEPCIEPCAWVCAHYRCTKLCYEKCNRRRCNRPCRKLLPCGHECIGICGEKCPSKCRICNQDEVQEIFFGNEDEADARFVELEDCGHIIEVTGLDIWMEPQERNTTEIQLKKCPKCSVEIRKNLRYGNIIRETLNDIEKVKEKIQISADKEEVQSAKIALQRETRKLEKVDKDLLKSRIGKIENFHQAHVIETCIQFLKTLRKIKKDLIEKLGIIRVTDEPVIIQSFMKQMKEVDAWVLKSREWFNEQQLSDLNLEMERLQIYLNMCIIEKRLEKKHPKLDSRVQMLFADAKRQMQLGKHLSTDERGEIRRVIAEIDKLVPASGLGITEEERVQIVKAIGLPRGHWNKCPNGHIYAIADCGGAMVEAKCPECDATIGGRNHALRSDNALAGEMDGARYSAWSQMANMQNFNLNDIR